MGERPSEKREGFLCVGGVLQTSRHEEGALKERERGYQIRIVKRRKQGLIIGLCQHTSCQVLSGYLVNRELCLLYEKHF